MCVSLRRHNFVAKVINNGRREVNTSWSGNNGCHLSQENVIKFWAALHPSLSNSCSV